MTRVIIADDHPLVREGLKHILSDCHDIDFADEVDNGLDLLTKLRLESYDIVLLDLFMPGKSGLELIKQIKSEFPKLTILILSTHKEDMYALRTLKAGASGYLCKDYAASALVDAIRKVASGGRYISPTVAELLANEFHRPQSDVLPHSLLSDREYQIFLLIASGVSSTEIAAQLNLSAKTVSTHKTRIKEKTKLINTSEFVRYAIKNGLISSDEEYLI